MIYEKASLEIRKQWARLEDDIMLANESTLSLDVLSRSGAIKMQLFRLLWEEMGVLLYEQLK